MWEKTGAAALILYNLGTGCRWAVSFKPHLLYTQGNGQYTEKRTFQTRDKTSNIVQRNLKARSHNNCCRGKAISIT
jgi:hypothetical protein